MITELCAVKVRAFPIGEVPGCDSSCPLFNLCEAGRELQGTEGFSHDDPRVTALELAPPDRKQILEGLSPIQAATVNWAIAEHRPDEGVILRNMAMKIGALSSQGVAAA